VQPVKKKFRGGCDIYPAEQGDFHGDDTWDLSGLTDRLMIVIRRDRILRDYLRMV
jgi:hypothetical protein